MSLDHRLAYHHLLAQNFLRNISLDGSHNDTALKIFNKPGSPTEAFPGFVNQNVSSQLSTDQVDGHGTLTFTPAVVQEVVTTEIVLTTKPGTTGQAEQRSSVKLENVVRKMSSRLKRSESGSSRRSIKSTLSIVQRLTQFSRQASPSTKIEETIPESCSVKDGDQTPKSRLSRSTTPVPFDSTIALDAKMLRAFSRVFFVHGGTPIATCSFLPYRPGDQQQRREPQSMPVVVADGGGGDLAEGGPAVAGPNLKRPRPSISMKRDPAGMARLVKQATGDSFSPLRPFDFAAVEEVSYSNLLHPSDKVVPVPASMNPTAAGSSTLSAHPPATSPTPIGRMLSAEPPSSRGDSTCGEPGPAQQPMLSARSTATAYSAPVSHQSSLTQTLPPYDPMTLNDPSFGPDTYKTTLAFSSFMSSILDYVNPTDLKKEVNSKFRDQFPDILITYTKFQSIKREMKKIAREVGLDHVALAHGYVYFEKLVLRGLVCKPNRKLVAGVCLVLAAKLHDTKGCQLRDLLQQIEDTFREGRKEILLYEIPVSVFLDFSLTLEQWEYEPHYRNLMWQ